ncbi:hypothetical protein DEH18_04665 [Streptomyces sp. NHF165]|nr:hypothetical protein DEH18_04665 [Streptomyces sp. NHF165]
MAPVPPVPPVSPVSPVCSVGPWWRSFSSPACLFAMSASPGDHGIRAVHRPVGPGLMLFSQLRRFDAALSGEGEAGAGVQTTRSGEA